LQAKDQVFTMNKSENPGAVAALGACVVDQLGRRVAPENNRQQHFRKLRSAQQTQETAP
jgi:hypothetical protein